MRLMSSRVAGAFLWAIVGGTASGSPMELKSIDGERLGAELQFIAPVYKAIGRISYRPTPDVTLEQSGFFVRSDLFMTTISPQQKEPLDCSTIKIFAGSYNFDAEPVEANYCDEVVEQDPKFGYAII